MFRVVRISRFVIIPTSIVACAPTVDSAQALVQTSPAITAKRADKRFTVPPLWVGWHH